MVTSRARISGLGAKLEQRSSFINAISRDLTPASHRGQWLSLHWLVVVEYGLTLQAIRDSETWG